MAQTVRRFSRHTARLCAVLLIVLATRQAAATEEASISVQGVQASEQGKNADSPDIDSSLSSYKKHLKNLGYGKYKDIGKDSGKAKAGGATSLTVGAYTVAIKVTKVEDDGTSISYTIKKGGTSIAQSSVKIKSGEISTVMVEKSQSPVILLFKSGE